MCSDSQEAVSVVLSGTPTEVMKKSQDLEYKSVHPQPVAVLILHLNLPKRPNFRELLVQKSNSPSMTFFLIEFLCLKTKCNEMYVNCYIVQPL